MLKAFISPMQKNETTVCIIAATPPTATAVSEFPLNLISGVSPLSIATRLIKSENPTRRKFRIAYAAGAKEIAEQIACGKSLVTTVSITDNAAIMPEIRLRTQSFLMLRFSS